MTLRLSVCLMLAASLVGAVWAEEKQRLEADPRLARAVTRSHERVYLGQLLEELTRSTGVPLSLDESTGPASGLPLAIHVKEQPLRELLGGLRELYSSRYNRWTWRAKDSGYVLVV